MLKNLFARIGAFFKREDAYARDAAHKASVHATAVEQAVLNALSGTERRVFAEVKRVEDAYTAEIAALKKQIASLKGQITKLGGKRGK